MKNERKEGRGGVRAGSGRPPRAGEPSTVQVAVRMTAEEAAELDRLASESNETRAEVVRRLIRDACGA